MTVCGLITYVALRATEEQRHPIRCSTVGTGKGNTPAYSTENISGKMLTLLRYTIVLKIIKTWSIGRIYLKKNVPY